ncbi:MAG: AMP-binding protein [Pseudomonadota bacterium]
MPLFDHIDGFSAAPCLVTDKTCLSFADVTTAADALYAHLPKPSRGLAVLLAYPNVDALIAYIGAVRHGFAVLLLDPERPADKARLAEIYRPDLVIDVLSDQTLIQHGFGADIHPDIATLLSTSGSTGAAKLVKLTHRNIRANTNAICQYLGLDTHDRGATNLKLFYSYGMSVVNTHLMSGASLLVTSLGLDDPAFWELAAEHGVTNIAGVPFTFEMLRETGFDLNRLPSLRLLTQAGGKLSPETVRYFAAQGARCEVDFYVMYGQTEASPRMSYLPPTMAHDAPESIGQAIPGGRLYVVDAAGHPIGEPGVSGELVFEGANVMAGYATSRADLAQLEEIPALYTGDIAHFDGRGLFYIDGRAARFVKPFGLRLSLDEIEQSLREEYGIVAVTGTDRRIVVALADPVADRAALLSTLAQRFGLPPAFFKVIDGHPLPRLSSSKVDYRVLLRDHASDPEPPSLPRFFVQSFLGVLSGRTRRAASVFDAFQSVMGHRINDPGQSFRAAGGDSLTYMQLFLLLEEYLETVPQNWAERSIAELEHLKEFGSV